MLEPRTLSLALLITLSLVACDKQGGESKPGGGSKSTVCQTDALMCPDGTAVGRQGPDCEFAPCPAPPEGQPVACTKEAKVCPDGSAVGRTGPNCEFEPCPGETPVPSE
jgi:hypothetical protein